MAKPRFFIDRPVKFSVTITGEDAHHIRDVIRLQTGEIIEVVDPGGHVSDAEITIIEPGEVIAKVIKKHEDRTVLPEVYLFQALPKAGKFDDIIRMTTEIGVVGIYPVVTERVVVKFDGEKAGKKLDRWRKIAAEAAKQSHRTTIPGVNPVLTWNDALVELKKFEIIITFWEEENTVLPCAVLESYRSELVSQFASGKPPQSQKLLPKIAVIIGPEGGLSEKEAADLKEAGANIVTMGESILRVETAAPVAIALVLYDLRKIASEYRQ
jgi:16S rRNA (uracil1498-N3)-methyltransferase